MSIKTAGLSAAIALLLAFASAQAIERVAPSFYMVEGYGGYAKPLGSYTGTAVSDFAYEGHELKAKAGDIYDDGFGFGVTYGKLYRGRWLGSTGIRYARHSAKDVFTVEDETYVGTISWAETPTYSQWDVDFNFNYQFLDWQRGPVSPYLGIGIHPGITAATFRAYESKYEFNAALGVNFGADFKIWTDPSNRAFVTISSINSWDFVSSGTRPRHLNIGGGLRYFFKM
jgi:hypothetical protein